MPDELRVERIVPDLKPFPAWTVLLIPFVLIGLGLVVTGLMPRNSQDATGLVLIGVGILSIVVIQPIRLLVENAVLREAGGRQRVAGRRALLAFIGGQPRYLDDGWTITRTGVAASAIAYADGRLYVLDAGLAAELPWPRLTNFGWRIEGAEVTSTYGRVAPDVAQQVQAENAVARTRAFVGSGITLRVRDPEHPLWRFTTEDRAVCERWMAIVEQMKRGELPAR